MLYFIVLILLAIIVYLLYQQTQLKRQAVAVTGQEKRELKFKEKFPNLFVKEELKEELEWFETRWGKGNGLGMAYDPYGLEKSIYNFGGEKFFKQHLEEEGRLSPNWTWTTYAENVKVEYKSDPEMLERIKNEIQVSRNFKDKVKHSKLSELEKDFLLYYYWKNRIDWEKTANDLARVYNYTEAAEKGLLDDKGIRLYEISDGDVSRFERK